jgi:hypothetical protein
MSGCTNKAECALFTKFSTLSAVKIWKLLYCERDEVFATCQRYRLKLRGEPVPVTLLPNGTHLKLD